MDKCLAFCQALATSNQKFTFSLTIGKDSFSFDNKELVSSSWQKKKKSPSQLRREAKRREERASKAAVEATGVSHTTEEVVEIISEPVVKDKPRGEASNLKFKCDQCHYLSVSAKGLSQHIRVKHCVAQVNGAVDTVSDNKESGGKHVGEAAEGAASSPPFPEPVMVPCKLDNCNKKFELNDVDERNPKEAWVTMSNKSVQAGIRQKLLTIGRIFKHYQNRRKIKLFFQRKS